MASTPHARLKRILKRGWAAPNTLLGLALGAVAALLGARWRTHDGVVEVTGIMEGRRLPFVAITFGHVVLYADSRISAPLRAHERAHVRQYERWGPFFLPAYILGSALAVCRGGRLYADNPFEQQARRAEAQSRDAA